MKKFALIISFILFLTTCVGCAGTPNVNETISSDYVYSSNISTVDDANTTNTNKTTTVTDGGIYTFYSKTNNKYLSFNGNNLVLSDNACKWQFKYVQNNGYNVYAYETDLMFDIDNAYVAQGTTVKLWQLTGYDVQIWNVSKNANGTFTFLYNGNHSYCLGFNGSRAELQLRDTNNSMQEWELTDISANEPKQYLEFASKNNIIKLQLPLDILNVISEARLQQWAQELEKAYYTFYELTNYKPYETIVVEAYKPSKYIGWVIDNSNIIHIDSTFIVDDLRKMASRKSDWNFCALHEMGHMFDMNRPWNFETELLTDLKLAYVLETNNVAAAPSEFDASTVFYGADIINAYNILGTDFSKNYDIFGATERFMKIKNDIGWEPFKKTFQNLQANEKLYSGYSKQQKFKKFVEKLSEYSGKDIKSYFSSDEWSTILNHCA